MGSVAALTMRTTTKFNGRSIYDQHIHCIFVDACTYAPRMRTPNVLLSDCPIIAPCVCLCEQNNHHSCSRSAGRCGFFFFLSFVLSNKWPNPDDCYGFAHLISFGMQTTFGRIETTVAIQRNEPKQKPKTLAFVFTIFSKPLDILAWTSVYWFKSNPILFRLIIVL